ncbi:MAG: FAD-dependent oxidoreductase [Deltaproteobacteria bacterium]|nr:FAD-dependent oxidoreductase [Deltaproteobacteria bacterium]
MANDHPHDSHDPPWTRDATPHARSPLATRLRTEVCVIGAGIAGLTTAYELAGEGRSVVVLDDGPIGGGMTSRTTAHLATAIDDRYWEIARIHGTVGARLAAASHAGAIDRIEEIATREGIDADFRRVDGFLFRGPEQPLELLQRELEAAHEAGLADVELLARSALPEFDTGPCLRFPRQGQLHPMKYLSGLADAFEKRGGLIFCGTHAEGFEGKPLCVTTDRDASVIADVVVVATNVPINDRFAIHTKQAPYMTYVVAARVPSGVVPVALYWDTLDPYHYVRVAEGVDGHDLLVVGGEDHKTGQQHRSDDRFARLEAWARLHFPAIGAIERRWSGQVMETIDGLAFIGRNPGDDAVYVVTGDSGMGMTHGTLAGQLIADLVVGRPSRFARLYDPARKPVRAGRDFLAETANVAAQYRDWVTPGEVSSAAEVPPGSGAIVRRGLHKLAVHRDASGTLHERSAVCPHLGCIVRWNDTEKTWDCPCHGSRFAAEGRVISGPANSDLAHA